MLYCLSLALSVSFLVFVIIFVFSLSSLTSLFPSICDIDGCATTAVSLVSGWVLYVVTVSFRVGTLCGRVNCLSTHADVDNVVLSCVLFLICHPT